jgi:predicted alpha/beta hydrolase
MTRTPRKLAFASIIALAALAGCSTTAGTGPRVSQSGFDGARIVTISPHGNACNSMICTGLGAQWSSKNPADAVLVVSLFNEVRAIVGAQLNIDGKVYDLSNAQPFTNFSDFGAATREARKGFIVPTDLIRQITASQRTWLRVTTTAGNFEDAVIDGQTDSKAFHALRRFLASVDQG